MAKHKNKLELTWIGKDKRPKLEPRILLEDPSKSCHAKHRVTDNDIFDNKLIFGDNLLALKALEQEYSGKVKCIYIDPPYNTGSAFEHYKAGRFSNLTIKKIPKMVLSRCEWAHDDYSLNVENLPQAEREPVQQDLLGDVDG